MRLLREARNKVETNVLNSRRAQNGNSTIDMFAAMHASSSFQFVINERLRPEADAVEPCGNPSSRFFLFNGLGVCLERNLLQRTRKRRVERLHHLAKQTGLEQARRPAAHVNRVHG